LRQDFPALQFIGKRDTFQAIDPRRRERSPKIEVRVQQRLEIERVLAEVAHTQICRQRACPQRDRVQQFESTPAPHLARAFTVGQR
jgi:hypothetical protein